jgi:NAD(P)-dependent dehydrogenase (short-subunit alcohol dehydrogenase family)
MGLVEGNTAIVTGAGNGIGRACALKLAAHGADLIVLDIEKHALDEVVAEIRAMGREAHAYELDMLDQAAIGTTFGKICAAHPAASILVNNVGRGAREGSAPIEELDPKFWNSLIDINLRAAIACTQHLLPMLKAAGGGRIVCIASDSAFTGTVAGAPYAAAKSGLIGFARSIAREASASGVTINVVAPGFIQTRAMDGIPDEVIERAVATTPLQRLGSPEDIANAVLFFASDMSSFVTGQTLLVNGGRYFH